MSVIDLEDLFPCILFLDEQGTAERACIQFTVILNWYFSYFFIVHNNDIFSGMELISFLSHDIFWIDSDILTYYAFGSSI